MSHTFELSTSSQEQWAMLTKSYTQKLPHALNELVDNSLAAFGKTAGDMFINIRITKETDDGYVITVSDNGPGIALADIPVALSAGRAKRSGLNEHGLGIKNVLAFCCPENTGFHILSVPIGSGKAYKVVAPWGSPFTCNEVSPSEHPYPTGLSITMRVTEKVLKYYGASAFKLDTLLGRLRHVLGVTYAIHPLLNDSRRHMRFTLNDEQVRPELPQFLTRIALDTTESKSLAPGRPPVSIHVKHYRLDKQNEGATEYYTKNMQSSGFYLFLHSRLIKVLSIKALYETDNHNSFNPFVCTVNVSGDPKGIPPTMTTKNGLLETDAVTQGLYEYIRRKITMADARGSAGDPRDRGENELVADFCEIRKANAADFGREYELYENRTFDIDSGNKTPPIDVLEIFAAKVIVYEAKRDTCNVDDVMQLWRNYRFIRRSPVFGSKEIHCVLLTSVTEPNPSAALILEDFTVLDPAFRFAIKTWGSYGIARTR
jgi:anti-sigma regulatory factor (Ser/Thr protein kinase)